MCSIFTKRSSRKQSTPTKTACLEASIAMSQKQKQKTARAVRLTHASGLASSQMTGQSVIANERILQTR